MTFAIATVFDHMVERLVGTVHVTVKTDRGNATLRFTPADAQALARTLSHHAATPLGDPSPAPTLNHITAAARGLPLAKPHGGVA